MEKNIPINKGNYSMESEEREKLFEQYRGDGWRAEYQKYRYDWEYCAKNQCVPKYPLLVDLELSTICNLKCPMCYTISPEFRQKVQGTFMEYRLFTKIIDEISGKVPAVRLSLRGEPTIHPLFIDCVHYAKEKGIGEVSMLTNGSLLDEEFFTKMMIAGIDWITISIDGLGETYENIRRPLAFSDTLKKIKKINEIKNKYGRVKPVVKIQSIWPAIRQQCQEFYDTFSPYVDLIAFNPLIDFQQKADSVSYIKNFVCPQLYQRLVIGSDGQVLLCANDETGDCIIGDANIQSVEEIWHGKMINSVREEHKASRGIEEPSVCAKCYLPRVTNATESACVNGRTFFILNYD